MGEQRRCFLEMESPPGEAAAKVAEMTTKDSEQCVDSS